MKKLKELIHLYFAFFRIGGFTFGGGYAMLPMLEKEIVNKYKWATTAEIMDYFAIGQCTPGIIAVNTATFVGYKNFGIIGGVVATVGVVTPSLIIISLIATVLSAVYHNVYVQSAFSGIGVAVCAVLVQAVIKIVKSGVIDTATCIIAVTAFVLSLFWDISTIYIIILAGVAGVTIKTVARRK